MEKRQRNQAEAEYRRRFQSFTPGKQKKKIASTKYVATGAQGSWKQKSNELNYSTLPKPSVVFLAGEHDASTTTLDSIFCAMYVSLHSLV